MSLTMLVYVNESSTVFKCHENDYLLLKFISYFLKYSQMFDAL